MGESFWPAEQPSFGTEGGANSVFMTTGVVAWACLRVGSGFFPVHAFILKSSPNILSLESGKCCKIYFHTSALIVLSSCTPTRSTGEGAGRHVPFRTAFLGAIRAGCWLRALGIVMLPHCLQCDVMQYTIYSTSEQIFTWKIAARVTLWRKSLALELK